MSSSTNRPDGRLPVGRASRGRDPVQPAGKGNSRGSRTFVLIGLAVLGVVALT
jgi:hypothetical protein